MTLEILKQYLNAVNINLQQNPSSRTGQAMFSLLGDYIGATAKPLINDPDDDDRNIPAFLNEILNTD